MDIIPLPKHLSSEMYFMNIKKGYTQQYNFDLLEHDLANDLKYVYVRRDLLENDKIPYPLVIFQYNLNHVGISGIIPELQFPFLRSCPELEFIKGEDVVWYKYGQKSLHFDLIEISLQVGNGYSLIHKIKDADFFSLDDYKTKIKYLHPLTIKGLSSTKVPNPKNKGLVNSYLIKRLARKSKYLIKSHLNN